VVSRRGYAHFSLAYDTCSGKGLLEETKGGIFGQSSFDQSKGEHGKIRPSGEKTRFSKENDMDLKR